MSLSSKIEELRRRWRDKAARPDGVNGHRNAAYLACADELNELLELAKEMERVIEGLREVSKGLRKFADEYSAAAKGASE